MTNLRWKVLTIFVVFVVFFAVGVYPLIAERYGIHSPALLMDKQLKLGLDLKGGVHLVLRVQTDDALRLTTEQEMERLREELKTRNISLHDDGCAGLDALQGGRHPAGERCARSGTAAAEVQTNFDRSAGTNGTYTFTLKPNVQVNLRDEAVVQARQTIERRVNELGVTEPSIAQQGTNGDQILVQLPGVTDVERAKEIIRSTGLLELKIVEQGPAPTKDALLVNESGPAGNGSVPGATGTPGDANTVFYLVKKAAAVTGQDLRNARGSLDENSQPAVSFTLSNEGGRKFGKVTGENIGRQLAIILDGRVQSAPRIDGADFDRGPHHRQLHAGRSAEPLADPAVRRAAGVADLPRGANDRAEPRRRLDPVRRARLGRRPPPRRRLHADLLQVLRRERGGRADLQPGDPARADGVYRRGDDAARHRRLRADDGHRRRLERADLRAHQGRARRRSAACAPRSTPASAACSGRWWTPTWRR